MPVDAREPPVGVLVHRQRRQDVEHGGPLDHVRMVEREPVRHTRAAVVPDRPRTARARAGGAARRHRPPSPGTTPGRGRGASPAPSSRRSRGGRARRRCASPRARARRRATSRASAGTRAAAPAPGRSRPRRSRSRPRPAARGVARSPRTCVDCRGVGASPAPDRRRTGAAVRRTSGSGARATHLHGPADPDLPQALAGAAADHRRHLGADRARRNSRADRRAGRVHVVRARAVVGGRHGRDGRVRRRRPGVGARTVRRRSS